MLLLAKREKDEKLKQQSLLRTYTRAFDIHYYNFVNFEKLLGFNVSTKFVN